MAAGVDVRVRYCPRWGGPHHDSTGGMGVCVVRDRTESFPAGSGPSGEDFFETGESVPATALAHVIGDGYAIVTYRPDLTANQLAHLRALMIDTAAVRVFSRLTPGLKPRGSKPCTPTTPPSATPSTRTQSANPPASGSPTRVPSPPKSRAQSCSGAPLIRCDAACSTSVTSRRTCPPRARYSARRPSRRTLTNPASRSLPRCCETAGRAVPTAATNAVTSCSPSPSSDISRNRVGSASIRNMSVAASTCGPPGRCCCRSLARATLSRAYMSTYYRLSREQTSTRPANLGGE